MIGLIKKIFIGLLTGLVNGSNHTKWIGLNDQKCMIPLTSINLHANEYSQEFLYYPFAVDLDRCVGSCNTFDHLSIKLCVSNKTEDLNLTLFSMITGINESKRLTKNTSCEFKCKFDNRKCNSDQWWNSDKCQFVCKKHHVFEKYYVSNHSTCNYENGII